MRQSLLLLVLLLLAAPSKADEDRVVHVRDPYEACERVTEERPDRLYALKCGQDHIVKEVIWLATFDLGYWSGAYTTFTVWGGRKLRTTSTPYPSVSSCRFRGGCTYSSTASVEIPLCELFSEQSFISGFHFKASGGPSDMMIHLSEDRLRRLRAEMVQAGFIRGEDYPLPSVAVHPPIPC